MLLSDRIQRLWLRARVYLQACRTYSSGLSPGMGNLLAHNIWQVGQKHTYFPTLGASSALSSIVLGSHYLATSLACGSLSLAFGGTCSLGIIFHLPSLPSWPSSLPYVIVVFIVLLVVAFVVVAVVVVGWWAWVRCMCEGVRLRTGSRFPIRSGEGGVLTQFYL